MKDPAAVNKTEPGIIGGPLRIHQKIFVPNAVNKTEPRIIGGPLRIHQKIFVPNAVNAVNKTKPGNFVPTRPTAGKNSGQERGKL